MSFYSLAVLLVIALLWIYALRRRPKHFSQHQHRQTAIYWIVGGGLVLPSISIALLLAFGIPMGYRLLPLPIENAVPMRVDVTGHQWWWEIHYPGSGITVINELHVPIGTPVDIHVTSADVIHSFWAPKLGGKVDAIPGRINVRRLLADVPGRSRGQCAEFCGLRHAHMLIHITAHQPEAFEAWLADRRRTANAGDGNKSGQRTDPGNE